MTRFHVDSDAVLAAETAVRGTIERLQGEVAAMHSQLVDLQSSWGGSAAAAFQGVVTEWKATQQRVEENLQGISLALGRAGQQYAETELANARLFGR